MTLKNFFLVLHASLSYLMIPNLAFGQVVYIVKPGETLSKIAKSQIGEPVYLKHGSLARLLRLNSAIPQNGKIYPGQMLLLPAATEIDSTSQEIAESFPSPKSVEAAADTSSRNVASEDEIPNSLSLTASLGMTTITAHDNQNNSKATLNSSRDLAVEGSWQQAWTKSFSTTFAARFRSIEFQSPTNSAYSLSNSKNNTLALSAGAQSQITENFSLSYSFTHGQELFLRGLSSTSVGVDELAISRFGLGGKYELFHKGKTSLGVKGYYEYLGAGSTDTYTIHSGSAYQAGLYLHRQYGADTSVEIHIGYRERAQKTSIVDAVEKTVFGALVFSIPLFEGIDKK